MRRWHRADRLRQHLASVDAAIGALPSLDPLGRLSLESYRDELAGALDEDGDRPAHAALVELTFGGEAVAGGAGIDAAFLAGAVGGLTDLVSRLGGTRGSGRLAVTAMSFDPAAVMLEELDDAGDLLFPSPLRRSVRAALEHLHQLAHGTDDDFGDLVESVEPRVLTATRDFIGRVSGRQGALVVAQADQLVRLDAAALDRAWRRLEATHVDEAPIRLTGQLLGIIPLGRRFEFQPDGGRAPIAGRVGEQISARYLAQLDAGSLAGRRWSALLARVTVERPGQRPTERYTLVDLDPADTTS
ncbi:MAG: hypothetical protein AB7I25_09225 [Vicinamibacterales bacterium]